MEGCRERMAGPPIYWRGWQAACLGRRSYAAHGAPRDAVRGGDGSGGYTGYAPEEWAAAWLWGGQAAEIEILEISVGVRMVK